MRRRRFIIIGRRSTGPYCYEPDCEFSKSGVCMKPLEFDCFYGREADDSFFDEYWNEKREQDDIEGCQCPA